MKRKVGKSKREGRRYAKGRGRSNKRSGLSMTFNREHRVPTNPGARRAGSKRRRVHR